jgi:lysine 2,3-aminomutase
MATDNTDKNNDKWSNWTWQQSNAIRSFDELKARFPWIERDVEKTSKYFNFQVTPYYLDLIDPNNPDDPIGRMILPTNNEIVFQPEELEDPIGDRVNSEDLHNSPMKTIVHRYEDRCLLFLTPLCSSYCRYCFRREIVSKPENMFSKDLIDAGLDYIRSHTEIKEVIFSGGDPLLVSDSKLAPILKELDAIPHLRSIRFHTRFPVFNPFRVTDELCSMLSALTKPVAMVVHVCHPNEVTAEFISATTKLIQSKVILLNQGVLLKGVNDSLPVMKELCYKLAEAHVKPYYIHYMDLAQGTSHFRIPILDAMELFKSLRGHISGYLIPQLILDIPGGYGKIPLEHSFIHTINTVDGKTEILVESPTTGKFLKYKEVLYEGTFSKKV